MNRKTLFLCVVLFFSVVLPGCGKASPLTPTQTLVPPTDTPAAEPTIAPTDTPTLQPTSVPPTNVPPTPALGTKQVNSKDGVEMVYVQAGDFSMGSDKGLANEQPVHTVHLDAFWIGKVEVTNAVYRQCVSAGACLQPNNQSNTHFNYYPDPLYANYPVLDLKWSSADKYCTWAGGSLPTEAQWEKAARGTDGRTYPWGETIPNNTLLNYNNPTGDTVAVGSFPLGASPFGVLDMLGNVREWVSDWYDAYYYKVSPNSNPTGPVKGDDKVVRGGSWHSDVYAVRASARYYLPPDTRDITVGFRCVYPAN